MSMDASDDEVDTADGFVDFGVDDVVEEGDGQPKPLSGRRKKAAKEQKRKSKPGTFGEHIARPCTRLATQRRVFVPC